MEDVYSLVRKLTIVTVDRCPRCDWTCVRGRDTTLIHKYNHTKSKINSIVGNFGGN